MAQVKSVEARLKYAELSDDENHRALHRLKHLFERVADAEAECIEASLRVRLLKRQLHHTGMEKSDG